MAQGKTYTVPTSEQPSYINKEMFIGMLAGIAFPVGGLVLGPLIVAAGTFGGAYLGRKRMESELTYGKPVKPPTLKNNGALVGGLLGVFPGVLIGSIATAIGPWLLIEAVEAGFMASLATSAGGMLATSAALGILTGGIAFAACVGVGALIGGFIGKKHMAKEYAEAQANDPDIHPELARARSMQPTIGKSPGPTPVAAMSTVAEDTPSTAHRDRITAESARINGLSSSIA